MVIYIANKIVYNFPTSVCKALVYVVQVYLHVYNDKLFYTLHRGRFRISNKEGVVHCDRACIGLPISCRWGGGRWDAGRSCTENYFKKRHFKAEETLFFILDLSQNGCSTSTGHQSPHESIILYSTGI